MTIRDALTWGTNELLAVNDGTRTRARLDADVLLAHTLSFSRTDLIVHDRDELVPAAERSFRALIAQRAKSTPIAYLTQQKEFYGLSFFVDERVLIPRPETEELIDLALPHITGTERILDIGTGTGAIAITLQHLRPNARITAIDTSTDAAAVAKKNAHDILGVDNTIAIIPTAVETYEPDAPFDIVIANPPYIPDAAYGALMPEVRQEPRTALTGGADGRDVIRAIIARLRVLLRPNGLFFFETNADQYEGILADFAHEGYNSVVHTAKDLSGKDRFVWGRLR